MATKKNRGIALVSVLILSSAVLLLVFGTVFVTQIELRITRNDTTYTQANYVAQAGLERYKATLFETFRWIEQAGETAGIGESSCRSVLDKGIDFSWGTATDGFVPWSGQRIGPISGEVLHGDASVVGTYDVWFTKDPNVNSYYTIRSTGRSGGAESTVEAVVEVDTVSAFRYAVFAGRGGGNTKFNGGAEIHGGVYVRGEADTEFSTNGNFKVLNSYDLSGAAYDDAADFMKIDATDDLCATFRLYEGQFDAGSASVDIGTRTNKLLGLYVADGTDDILVTGTGKDATTTEDIESSCKANGGLCVNEVGSYDLDRPLDLPTLPGNITYGDYSGTFEQYLESRSDSGSGAEFTFDTANGITIPSGLSTTCQTQLESAWDASTQQILFDNQAVTCGDPTTIGFRYDPATIPATLTMYGDTLFTGVDVRFGRDVNYVIENDTNATFSVRDSVRLDGTGPTGNDPAAVGGDIVLGGNFRPDPSNILGGRFPDEVLGLVAEEEVRQIGDHVMAPVYAGYRFRSEQDNVLYGTVLTDEYCTTSAGGDACNAGQTSQVIYVDLGANIPTVLNAIDPGRGNGVFRTLSWTER